METQKIHTETAGATCAVSSRFPRAGTILIPRPDKKHFFKEGAKYIVTKADEDKGGQIGDYWMVSPENGC